MKHLHLYRARGRSLLCTYNRDHWEESRDKGTATVVLMITYTVSALSEIAVCPDAQHWLEIKHAVSKGNRNIKQRAHFTLVHV